MKKVIYAVMSFVPVLALAQTANLSGISTLVDQFGSIIAKVIPILFALAIIYFFWGVIKYIRSAGDPKAASEGKSIMIWGVIAIAVMLSIYGLVNWLQSSFGINNQQTAPVPCVSGLPCNS
jgi:hypothetical protein